MAALHSRLFNWKLPSNLFGKKKTHSVKYQDKPFGGTHTSVVDPSGTTGTRPLLVQILSFSCSFQQKIAKKQVGAPVSEIGAPVSEIGAPPLGKSWIRPWTHCFVSNQSNTSTCRNPLFINSAIHKAAGLTVRGRSTGFPGIIPKISKKTTVQNDLLTTFCTAAGHTAALWIGLLGDMQQLVTIKCFFFQHWPCLQ